MDQLHKLQDVDVTIVGGGILGLAHAWMASRRGLSVRLIERSPRAQGASVRNFGMIWPIGQTAGENYATALRSRELWLEIAPLAKLPIESCGSIHAAHHDDEMETLEEFQQLATHDVRLVSAPEAVELAPIINAKGLRGGLYSPTELRVNPRHASAMIAAYLQSLPKVSLHFDTAVSELDGNEVICSSGETWRSEQVVICSGSDLSTLYPKEFANSQLKRCKLQMLSTKWAADLPNLPHVASGLTLRHYKSFEACKSLQKVRQRIAAECPELDQYGIHVMASAQGDGQMILGDSHEYDEQITPFDKEEINLLMLRELRKVVDLKDWTIHQRWHGTYVKHPELIVFEKKVAERHMLCTGVGGAGMTLSFGLAEKAWKCWMGDYA